MSKKLFLLFVAGMLVLLSSAPAREKLRFTSPVKDFPPYYLIIFAAEEKGFWKANGLDVEWVPFTSGPALNQAVAAKAVSLGFAAVPTHIMAVSRGLPVVLISRIRDSDGGFYIWVRAGGPFKRPQDLKGAKIAVSRLGSTPHAYGQLVARKLGLEKEIRFIGVGGWIPTLAMLKTKVIDGGINTISQFLELKLRGEVIDLVPVADYLPQPWIASGVFVRKDFINDQGEQAGKAVRAVRQAIDFIFKNRSWAIEKMKAESGFSEPAAGMTFDRTLYYSSDDRIDTKALENITNVMIEFGIIPKEKAPPVNELFTRQFTG